MNVAPSSPSPYAAPNTPIASSKRLRVNATKGLRSPVALPQRLYQLDTPERDENKVENSELARKNTTRLKPAARPIEPHTPSKNLFSPSLRENEKDKEMPKRLGYGIDMNISGDSEDGYSLICDTIEETSFDTPDEEIKQPVNEDSVSMEDDADVFNPYQFIAQLPPYEETFIRDKICLPPPNHSHSSLPTLVLDLDETLVHCTVEPIQKPDLIFPVEFNGAVYQVFVRKRPYLDYFLDTVSKHFEVVLFTASQKVYADVLLDKLDPSRKNIHHRLFREACLMVQGNYLKDLGVLGRGLHRTVLVDNSPHAYAYQVNNGIPIESWYDDESDTELLKLIGFLKKLQGHEDFRPLVRDHFRTHHLVARAKKGLPVSLTAPPF